MNSIRVLLVDDNQAFSRAATGFLRAVRELQVVGSASSAAQAFEMIATLKPELVLMDIVMPGINGVDATRQIKRQADAPKVIILTLSNTPTHRADACAAGADGFVAKENLVIELPAVVRTLFPKRNI